MSVEISLPPDLEHSVRERAAHSGQDVTGFVLQAVHEKIASTPTPGEMRAEPNAAEPGNPGTDPQIERKFLALAAIWRYRVGPSSSITQMVADPAYLQIIGLGRAVLPHLLRELARQPDHWFSALSAITGEGPIPTGAEGNLAAMTEAWLAWGRTHGCL